MTSTELIVIDHQNRALVIDVFPEGETYAALILRSLVALRYEAGWGLIPGPTRRG